MMELSFLEQFERHKASQTTALICGEVSLTYAKLYERCFALAKELRACGVGLGSTTPEDYDIFDPGAAAHSPWVLIISDRSVDAVIGAIATWMAGGAYVLMEDSVPDAYRRSIIEDMGDACILREGKICDAKTGEPIKNDVGKSGELSYVFPKENEIACAVFTSGTTGRPKGAVLEHRVINEMLQWQTTTMNPAGWTATATYAPFGFIAATWELFFPLSNGLALHILQDIQRHDLFVLESYIESNQISYLFLPPDIAEIFTQTYRGNALKYLRLAGGRLNACVDIEGRYEIMYHLGMAENGGSVTYKPIRKAMHGDIPIGKPWYKTRVDLLEETGEMAVSGPSLFRGYLSRREETLQKRVKNPYTSEPGYEMMYLSGDLACLNKEGELVHMGRNDWTVKIRGMKVNPVQVEKVLGACPGVRDCCVTTQMQNDEPVLIGWVTGNKDTQAIKEELLVRLPEYMIPLMLIALDELPRNKNGKVDRSALVYVLQESNTGGAGHTGRMSDAQAISTHGMKDNGDVVGDVVALFVHVLGLPAGPDDHFLALGGDSLKLMRLQAGIARLFSQNIPYTLLYDHPTPRGIAGLLADRPGLVHISTAEPGDVYPLSGPMRQMWLLWRTGQDHGKYTVSIQCRFAGTIDSSRVITSFQELTRRHAILRSSFLEDGAAVFQRIEEKVDVLISDRARGEFDLSKTPLFDITLHENVLCFTTHHIIADAAGLRNLIEDFWTLYGGGEPEKSVQAHDVTMWSLKQDISAEETYWNHVFDDRMIVPMLPHDFPRPSILTHASKIFISFEKADAERLRAYAISSNATVFQLFLAAYALLLTRLTGSESVVVGVPFAGREHPDTQRTIGMLVKTLPVRLDPGSMVLAEALVHTRERLTKAWEHQNISLERLTEVAAYPRTPAGNAFYDVMINYVPFPSPLPDVCGLRPEVIRGEYSGALFDLVLDVREELHGFSAVFTYANELFKPETINRWAEAFRELLLTQDFNLPLFKTDMSVQGKMVPDSLSSIRSMQEEKTGAALGESTSQCMTPQLVALLSAWQAVLEIETVSPSHDFLADGGTSLAAIRLEAALFEKGWLLCAADILQNPVMHEMAALMTTADEIDWEEDA